MLISNSNHINIINYESFEQRIIKGNVSYRFSQSSPYHLLINVNYPKDELKIEFSGKILRDDYVSLINIGNIRNCLNNIQQLGIAELDIDGIMNDAVVTKCDVTMDVPFDLSQFPDLVNDMKQSLANYDRWHCDPYANGNFTNGVLLHNTAKNSKNRKSLSIYNKAIELTRACNRDFLHSIQTPEGMIEYFSNKLRFELNLNTKVQIREFLNIQDNSIESVLLSEENPIAKVIRRAFAETTLPSRNINQRMRERIAFIQSNGNDLRRVEAAIRETTTQSIGRAMRPYREAFAMMETRRNVKQTLLDLVA